MNSELFVERMMDYVVDHACKDIDLSEEIGNVFDQLIWIFEDNGADIEVVREKWLMSNDFKRISVALNMNSVYPFIDEGDMISCLNRISQLYPSLEYKCQNLINDRLKNNLN